MELLEGRNSGALILLDTEIGPNQVARIKQRDIIWTELVPRIGAEGLQDLAHRFDGSEAIGVLALARDAQNAVLYQRAC